MRAPTVKNKETDLKPIMVSNPFLLYTQKPHTLRIKAAFFEEGGLGEGTFFLQKEGSFPQKTPHSLKSLEY